ncbi:MAG: polymer-forming cytoskeletal protein [Zoogloeaceae bacterium]|nr:polymer-forming cytoskeletal protein [Zoogloeaceae bacterium]MCK6384010.1 polymer-forming cytoskeletal protein [Rhodocyclaceae bacterium]
MLDKMQLFGKQQNDPPLRPGATLVRRPGETAAPPAPPPSTPQPTATAAKAESRAESLQGSRLIVGPDIKLKGAEISDCGTLVVEGRVEAVLDSQALQIAEQGAFSGRVVIDVAEIQGHFDGDLLARRKLVVHATGQVTGKIRYGKIVIEEGGEVSGDVRSLASEQPVAASSAPEEAKRPDLAGLDAVTRPRPALQK